MNDLIKLQKLFKSFGYKEVGMPDGGYVELLPNEYTVERFDTTSEVIIGGDHAYLSYVFDENGSFVEHVFN